ncbi:DUF3802 family protein [Psychrobium sp. MM17-31]|uniref:DUF3802 family protein n=1 Tax=Psychrobium sp. MM17-31 TaxID=2917758 RepID=UPI001EF4BBC1|nr:DUF3802 family protein [Psychrobium sp. MM17-31]MCG7531334.1 DUF3802 family protein [Psychrobium sp. MM17-31]
MVIQSEGYSSLIEYLCENIAVFGPSESEHHQPMTIKLYIRYQLVEQMSLLFEQNKGLIEQEKIYIVEEFDKAYDDLCEVLGQNVNNKITESQRAFITDFAGLLKNLFDAQLEPV